MRSFLTLIFFLLLTGTVHARERLDLQRVSLDLPGPPAALVAADLDGDGRRDLAAVVVYTEWDQIGIEERTTMDDVEGVVEVMTIVPALFDRRELHFFRAEDGGWRRGAPPLSIDSSILSLLPGPDDAPLVVLTDDGLSEVVLTGGTLGFAPLIEKPPLLARSRTFVADLDLVHDLDGDGRSDLLFPAREGLVVYLAKDEGLQRTSVVPWPEEPARLNARRRHFALPEVRDVTGDGLPDLLSQHDRSLWEHFSLATNLDEGRFESPVAPLGLFDPDAWEERYEDDYPRRRTVYFGDLDGDGRGEYVSEESLADDEGGMRKEMREAKRPPFRFRIHDSVAAGAIAEPKISFDALGYAFVGEAEDEMSLPGGFRDLDGDGRQDLVTLTLDFSIMQAVRVMATKSLSIGLDFHVFCQEDAGGFREITGLDLSGKFKLNLNRLRIGQLSQFSGDFDGDGRADFVQIGRGRDVSIHRGQDGCIYPSKPDLSIRLDEEPRDLALVRIEDFDGDERADLLVIAPRPSDDPGVTAPVRLDFYLSGETR